MRLFLLVLLMVRPFGFLTLSMLFHGSAESALALAEIPHGHGWKGDETVVRSEGVPQSVPPIGPSLHVKLSTPPSSTVLSLPYPHHDTDCSSISCNDPLTPAPSGSPCGCVLPINVQLQLNMALDTFFPLVSELEREIAASTSLNISQVKTIGAEVANQQPDKTNVAMYLLPIGKGFNQTTFMSIYLKFWSKQVLIDNKLFGAYDVLDVRYPVLFVSPPAPLSSNAAAASASAHGPNN